MFITLLFLVLHASLFIISGKTGQGKLEKTEGDGLVFATLKKCVHSDRPGFRFKSNYFCITCFKNLHGIIYQFGRHADINIYHVYLYGIETNNDSSNQWDHFELRRNTK